jgi:hypothetical protein
MHSRINMCIIHQHIQQVMATLDGETHVLGIPYNTAAARDVWLDTCLIWKNEDLQSHLVSLLGVSSRCTARLASACTQGSLRAASACTQGSFRMHARYLRHARKLFLVRKMLACNVNFSKVWGCSLGSSLFAKQKALHYKSARFIGTGQPHAVASQASQLATRKKCCSLVG